NGSVSNVSIESEEDVQYGAVIGQPVQWKKKVVLTAESAGLELELPPAAQNLTIFEVVNGSEVEVDLEEVLVNESGLLKNIQDTDLVEKEVVELAFFTGLLDWVEVLTGYVVADEEEEVVVQENVTLIVNETVEELIIEYFTEAPITVERNLSSGKEIVVSSQTHYENILTYTWIEDTPLESVNLYWIVNGTRQSFPFDAYDTNENGLVDYLEWVTPHLSNETFEVELTILNVQSYPTVGGNWVVEFNTTGSANLTIQADNGTTWSLNSTDPEEFDLKFLELKCGDSSQSFNWTNSSMFKENYTCSETSSEISNVLTPGVHTIRFDYGSVTAYAYNDAGENLEINTDTIWTGNMTYDNVTITNGATLLFNNSANANETIMLTAVNLSVCSTCAITSMRGGYKGGQGPGSGADLQGGTHGGTGGDPSAPRKGVEYGSIIRPVTIGSGGGNDFTEGQGGGAILLNISDTLTVDGLISSNASTEGSGGAGSGGSVYIIVDKLVGTGTISADGGRTSASNQGSGGGGRVAIYYTTNSFTGNISASAGKATTNNYYGAAGTVYMKSAAQTNGDLITTNSNYTST
ncbi:MAG: hypothetical protein QF535_06420, partial [Anaerolineales bacterium]|nr:hypothetical protein [Anaerolineales bacterium]